MFHKVWELEWFQTAKDDLQGYSRALATALARTAQENDCELILTVKWKPDIT